MIKLPYGTIGDIYTPMSVQFAVGTLVESASTISHNLQFISRISTRNTAGHLPHHRYCADRTAAVHKAAAAVAYDNEAFSACGSHDYGSNGVRADSVCEECVTLSGERERGGFGPGPGS